MAVLLSAPYNQFLDDDGNPLTGGFVYTYEAGTDTPKATYTSYTGTIEAENPVELDAAGRADIWIQGNYKITVKDANGVIIRTVDHIEAVDQGGDMTKAVYDPANIQQQLVGLTAVQTLTNKTISAASNTINLTALNNSIAAPVSLNNTATFFDGPIVSQGTSGTWFASGTVTLLDTAGAANFIVKLWDGTTTIASAYAQVTAANTAVAVAVSGYITSPAGDIRISARDSSSTSGSIQSNVTGVSKDSTISAFRIG